ncbi:MAG TPA: DNA polymerase ligase N-terminal domain-containing protein [Vicinamibacterales bacterium]|nr:DNA polymerase ligase N-terminal domain-containing protein [Vicinamibacterales bacterium]
MALDEYRRKRDFNKTPEPDGSAEPKPRKAKDGLFFSVQKHLASHLHYDLRLEWNGVLLSWAIPKGPSIDPADKRLAMQTEDHPFDYGTFEGVIPEGYGAGIVMLWDSGTWIPESPDVDAALRKGDMKFRLEGYKLKGSWALIRTRGFGSGSKPSWLLIKHKDEWAGPVNITEFAPLSVKTADADFADILAADNPAIWRSNAPAKTGDAGKLFQRIIAQAVAMKTSHTTSATGASATANPTSAKKATRSRKAATAKTKAQTKKPGRA